MVYEVIDEKPSKETQLMNMVNSKERIITYYRNELLIMYVEDIAFTYKEDSVTYVVNMEGKKSIVNDSLDNLMLVLDPGFFFRVNRQFIIQISAIRKIIKTGSNLKIETHPPSDHLIIIGKNKSASFKKWIEG